MKILIEKCIPIPAIQRPGRKITTTHYPLKDMVVGDSIRLKIGTKELIESKKTRQSLYAKMHNIRKRDNIQGTFVMRIKPVDSRYEIRYWKTKD